MAGPLRLDELIDLELELLRDRDRPIEELDARDEPLVRRLHREHIEGRPALRAWLEHVRGTGPSVGARVAELRELTALVLFGCGALAGVATVGGWLLQGTGTPVNVIHLWPAVIGVQLLLLGLWCVSALPRSWVTWIPGVPALQSLLQGLATALPRLAGRVLLRGVPPERASLASALAELRRVEWLYGRLRLWLVTGLTQALAIGWNVGALVAFVAIPYIDDPAFGWRSRLWDPPAVHTLASRVAAPWSPWLPRARPSPEDVVATRYSSIDPSFAAERPGPDGVWAVWWPFLVASLLVYGLTPRCLLLASSWIGVRRELRRAPRAHADVVRLRERLAYPALDTRATLPETPGLPGTQCAPTSSGGAALPTSPVRVLCWSGVPLDDACIRADLEAAGLALTPPIARVGTLDPEEDRRTLAALRATDDRSSATCLVVAAWEPPVGDYLDLVRDLRRALGAETPFWVLLHTLDAPTADDADVEAWHLQLRSLGDPYLRVARWPGRAS